MPTLFIDLDGVMADFDGAFPAVFGLDHRSLADDEMWLHINGHASFFRDLPPMAGAIEFFRSVEHLNPVILTACPKSNYPHVAAQKRAWVREHLSQTCLVLPVLGGRHKALFMHQPGDVLIDDFGKNCAAWAEAGGHAIKHEGDWEATRAALPPALAALASDTGERGVVAWLHEVAADDGEPDQALSFSRDSFPLEGVAGYRTVSVRPLVYGDALRAQPAVVGARGEVAAWARDSGDPNDDAFVISAKVKRLWLASNPKRVARYTRPLYATHVPCWALPAVESALSMIDVQGYWHSDLAAFRDWLKEKSQ